MNKQRCLCFFALLLFPALVLAQEPAHQTVQEESHGLKAVVNGKTVTLSFTETTAGTTFNMYRLNAACPATVSPGTFTKINSAPIAGSPYTDTATPPGTYCYYATAFLALASPSESAPSNLVAAVVPPSTPDPPVLANPTVN